MGECGDVQEPGFRGFICHSKKIGLYFGSRKDPLKICNR